MTGKPTTVRVIAVLNQVQQLRNLKKNSPNFLKTQKKHRFFRLFGGYKRFMHYFCRLNGLKEIAGQARNDGKANRNARHCGLDPQSPEIQQ